MIEISNEFETLALPNMLGIRTVSDVYDRILDLFQKEKSIVLSIPDDTVADLSFIQIIESARNYAKLIGVSINIEKPCGFTLESVLRRGGFLEKFVADDKKFWFHKEDIQ